MQVAVFIVDAKVPLRGVFGSELRVAHKCIIKVVERRGAEDAKNQ